MRSGGRLERRVARTLAGAPVSIAAGRSSVPGRGCGDGGPQQRVRQARPRSRPTACRLREHVLAAAIRAAEAELRHHGYADAERSAEILHVALEDALDEPDEAIR